MDKCTRNFIIGIFMLHFLSIIAVILAFYTFNVDPRALRILLYYLASFLTVYFISVFCYLLFSPDQDISSNFDEDISQPSETFQI